MVPSSRISCVSECTSSRALPARVLGTSQIYARFSLLSLVEQGCCHGEPTYFLTSGSSFLKVFSFSSSFSHSPSSFQRNSDPRINRESRSWSVFIPRDAGFVCWILFRRDAEQVNCNTEVSTILRKIALLPPEETKQITALGIDVDLVEHALNVTCHSDGFLSESQ